MRGLVGESEPAAISCSGHPVVVIPKFPEKLIELGSGDVALLDEEHSEPLLLIALVPEQGLDLEGREQLQEDRLFPESAGKRSVSENFLDCLGIKPSPFGGYGSEQRALPSLPDQSLDQCLVRNDPSVHEIKPKKHFLLRDVNIIIFCL